MTASTIIWKNNANTTLAGTVSNVATTATLTPGAGALFPAPGADQYFTATFSDAATGLLNEIVHVTNVTGDVVTMARAQEGTTALNWAAGDLFSNLVTAGSLEAFGQVGVNLRTLASANLIFYVATTGSDSTGDGSIGTPWATLQHAADVVQQTYDLAGQYSATINVADGTYNGGVIVSGATVGSTGNGSLIFVGNAGTPANVIVNNGGGDAFRATEGAKFNVTGLKITALNSGLNAIGQGSEIAFSNVNFGACGFAHIFANGGQVSTSSNYAISGSSPSHFFAQIDGNVQVVSSTVTLTGTPAFSTAFAQALRAAVLYTPGLTFSGSATGPRFAIGLNSVVETGTAGVNLTYFPGSSAGATSTGGQYY